MPGYEGINAGIRDLFYSSKNTVRGVSWRENKRRVPAEYGVEYYAQTPDITCLVVACDVIEERLVTS